VGDTIAPFIESLSFTRAKNDACIFYRKETGMIVLLYVDHLYLDGMTSDGMKFYESLLHVWSARNL
jgi:hypothetical protein